MLNLVDMLRSIVHYADDYYVPRVCGFQGDPFPVFSGKELAAMSDLIKTMKTPAGRIGRACWGVASVLDPARSYIVAFFSPVGQGCGLCVRLEVPQVRRSQAEDAHAVCWRNMSLTVPLLENHGDNPCRPSSLEVHQRACQS